MKMQKRLRNFTTFASMGKVFSQMHKNFEFVRIRRRAQLRSIFYTIRIYCNYKNNFCKKYGGTLLDRNRHLMRRCFEYATVVSLPNQENRAKMQIKEFLKNILPSLKIKNGVEKYKKSINYISHQRKNLVVNRIYKNSFYK